MMRFCMLTSLPDERRDASSRADVVYHQKVEPLEVEFKLKSLISSDERIDATILLLADDDACMHGIVKRLTGEAGVTGFTIMSEGLKPDSTASLPRGVSYTHLPVQGMTSLTLVVAPPICGLFEDRDLEAIVALARSSERIMFGLRAGALEFSENFRRLLIALLHHKQKFIFVMSDSHEDHCVVALVRGIESIVWRLTTLTEPTEPPMIYMLIRDSKGQTYDEDELRAGKKKNCMHSLS